MHDGEARQRIFTIVLFLVYLFFLVWIVLFKADFSIEGSPEIRSLNLIPFGGSAMVNGQANISEVLNNFTIFIPFGVYMALLAPSWGFMKKWLPIVLSSLAFEALQYALAIGRSDVTDLISNSLGGAAGIAIVLLLIRLFKSHCKTMKLANIIMCIGTALIGLLTLLIFINNPV